MSIQKKQPHKIILSGEILPGSVSASFLACGKKNCACSGEKPRLHGPYYRWTGFINNKKTTVTLHASIIEETQKKIENYKELLNEIETIKIKALNNAPWTKLKKL